MFTIWKRNVLGRGNSDYRGSEMRSCLCVVEIAGAKKVVRQEVERSLWGQTSRVL